MVIASTSLDLSTDSAQELDAEEILDDGELLNGISESDINESANDLLKKIRVKNVNRIVIGTLNINSLPNKFSQKKSLGYFHHTGDEVGFQLSPRAIHHRGIFETLSSRQE